jgi:hypothetical protein
MAFLLGAAAGIFGGKKSKTETVNETTIVNESVFNMLSESINATSAKILAKQSMSLSGVDSYCRLEVNQISNLDVKVMQKFDEQQTQDLMNKIMTDLDKKAKQAVEQKTGWMSLGSSKSKNVDKTMTNITNKVKKNITSRLINKIAGEVATEQELKIKNLKLDPYGIGIYERMGQAPPKEVIAMMLKAPPCKIDQNLQIRYVSEQLGSKIIDIVNKDEGAQKLAQEIDQASKQESQGVGGAVAEGAEGIGKGIGDILGAGTMPSIVSAIVSCVCCGAILAFGMSPAGQSLTKNAGAKAMKRF